jgi:hypothetical protein
VEYLLDVQPGLWKVLAATTGEDVTRYVHDPRGLHYQQQPMYLMALIGLPKGHKGSRPI